jgi:hypothetical protein
MFTPACCVVLEGPSMNRSLGMSSLKSPVQTLLTFTSDIRDSCVWAQWLWFSNPWKSSCIQRGAEQGEHHTHTHTQFCILTSVSLTTVCGSTLL